VVREAEVVVRAEVDDGLAVDDGVEAAGFEGAEVGVDLLLSRLADTREIGVGLDVDPGAQAGLLMTTAEALP
jgi:hypothetical protein